MIVVTLTAKAPKGPLVLTECKAHLRDGDKIHCEPDFGNALVAKFPDNLVRGPYWDRAEGLSDGKWQLELATVAPVQGAAEPPMPAADRSLGSQRTRARANVKAKENTVGG